MIRRMNIHGTQQAFSRLQESEERYRHLIELLPDALVVFADYHILYANSSAAKLIGAFSPMDLIGKSIMQFLRPETLPAMFEMVDGLMEGHDPFRLYHQQLIRFDRQPVDIEATAGIIKYDGQKAVQLIIRDVSKRNKIEKTLVETENLYHHLLENTVAGVFLAHEHKILYANPYLVNVLGYTLEHFLQLRPLEFLAEEEFLHLKERLFNGSPNLKVSFNGRGITKDKRFIDLEGSFTLVTFNGEPAILGTLHDVTFKKERENELLESSKMYQRLIKFIPEPIVLTDEGFILYANNSAAELLGLSGEEEWLGQSIFSFMHEDDHVLTDAMMKSIMETDMPSPFLERRLKCKDGRMIEAEMSTIRIRNYMGKTVLLTVIRDLTERKKSEEMLVRSEKLSLIGQMAAGVAHEIRNPLTALKGFTQLLKSRNRTDDKHYFDIMMNELDRISLIVDEFMSLAKPQPAEFKQSRAEHIVSGVYSLLESQAIMAGVEIRLELESGLPAILCDENQIKQVIVNLVKNAIEAMPHGGSVTLSVKNMEGNRVLIAVQDTGTGIPPELLSKIGEPFLTTKEKGTGLGLMICNRIVEAHHGGMRITSGEKEGTRVEIVLPSHKI